MPLFCQNLQQTVDSTLVCILPMHGASPVTVRRRPRKRKSTPVKPLEFAVLQCASSAASQTSLSTGGSPSMTIRTASPEKLLLAGELFFPSFS
jgi:hypothetical protein